MPSETVSWRANGASRGTPNAAQGLQGRHRSHCRLAAGSLHYRSTPSLALTSVVVPVSLVVLARVLAAVVLHPSSRLDCICHRRGRHSRLVFSLCHRCRPSLICGRHKLGGACPTPRRIAGIWARRAIPSAGRVCDCPCFCDECGNDTQARLFFFFFFFLGGGGLVKESVVRLNAERNNKKKLTLSGGPPSPHLFRVWEASTAPAA